jgi:hypothetical protein
MDERLNAVTERIFDLFWLLDGLVLADAYDDIGHRRCHGHHRNEKKSDGIHV